MSSIKEVRNEEFLDLLLHEDEGDFDSSLVGEECPFNPDDETCKEFRDNVATKKSRGVSYMSTIAEESQILDESVSSTNEPGSSKGDNEAILPESLSNAAQNIEMQTSETFTSAEFVRGGGVQMQKHEESYLKSRCLNRNDYRFNRSHQEKENSWEPSIHDSALPIPLIQETALLEKLNTNSHISIDDDFSEINKNRAQKSLQPKDSNVNCDSPALRTSLTDAAPKISTPNAESKSKREQLRNITLNFDNISAILPVNNGVICGNDKYSEKLKNCAQVNLQNDILSSSAIKDAIGSVGMNDTALLNALFKAKSKIKEHSLKGVADVLQNTPSVGTRITSNLKETVGKGILRKQLKDDYHCNVKTDNLTLHKNLPELPVNERFAILSAGANRCTSANGIVKESFSGLVSEKGRAAVLTFKPAFLYFGFVELNAKVNGFIRLRNISPATVNLKISLKSNKGFKLVDQGIVVLHPNETYSAHIIFQPIQAAYYRNILRICVLNADHLRYSIPLEGSGGAASLEVVQGDGINMARDGSIVVKIQGQTSILFDLENKGIRDAFVKVIVKDKNGKTVDKAEILPSDFVVILRHKIQRFEINLVDDFSNSRSIANGTHASSRSLHISSPEYFVQLLWGQEGQRRKLRRLEELKGKDILVADLSFTNRRAYNEEASKKTSAEKSDIGDFDLEAFESGLRIISVSIVNNRFLMSAGHLSERPVSESVMLNPDETLASTFSNVTVHQDVSSLES